MYGLEKYNALLNKKFERVEINENGYKVSFIGENSVIYSAEGDCCSQTFIESIDSPEVFENAVILSVEEVHGESKEIESHEVHKWTFVKFVTDKGRATLSFRNESNGYYDGYLELCRNN
jgi:hypothetical protein